MIYNDRGDDVVKEMAERDDYRECKIARFGKKRLKKAIVESPTKHLSGSHKLNGQTFWFFSSVSIRRICRLESHLRKRCQIASGGLLAFSSGVATLFQPNMR